MFFLYTLGYLVTAIIWGIITYSVNNNKGYYGGFWWGFFLGFIGLIVVACKTDNRTLAYYRSQEEETVHRYNSNEINNARLINEGGWKCAKCGRTNANYVTSCICGISKKEMQMKEKELNTSKLENLEVLAKYKELFDSGAITEEEFEKKKRQILGV